MSAGLSRWQGALAVSLSLLAGSAFAQNYPTRPVRMIVPFSPGGIYDYLARLVAPKLGESLGQTVVPDNRPGGGGVIAMQLATKAAPDGYTVLLADPSLINNVHLHHPAPYDLKDLTAVTILTSAGLVLAVNPKVPAQSVKELIDISKTQAINYGSAGVGSAPHMAAELFKIRTKANFTHVPFKGVGPATTAVVAGEVQMLFGSVAGVQGYVKEGRLRALATTAEKRANAMPTVRTLAEAGFPGAEVLLWAGIFVPTGTARPIVVRLNTELRKALSDGTVKAGLDTAAIEPVGTSPEEASAFLKREYDKWGKVIKTTGIKID
jgi:tripartite-type tricarboxylate transporter receptor subunit TctC